MHMTRQVFTHIGPTLNSATHIGPPRIQQQFPVLILCRCVMVTQGFVVRFPAQCRFGVVLFFKKQTIPSSNVTAINTHNQTCQPLDPNMSIPNLKMSEKMSKLPQSLVGDPYICRSCVIKLQFGHHIATQLVFNYTIFKTLRTGPSLMVWELEEVRVSNGQTTKPRQCARCSL